MWSRLTSGSLMMFLSSCTSCSRTGHCFLSSVDQWFDYRLSTHAFDYRQRKHGYLMQPPCCPNKSLLFEIDPHHPVMLIDFRRPPLYLGSVPLKLLSDQLEHKQTCFCCEATHILNFFELSMSNLLSSGLYWSRPTAKRSPSMLLQNTKSSNVGVTTATLFFMISRMPPVCIQWSHKDAEDQLQKKLSAGHFRKLLLMRCYYGQFFLTKLRLWLNSELLENYIRV